MHTLAIEAKVDNLHRVLNFVDEHLPADTPGALRSKTLLCAEEIFVNIASYAYAPGEGSAEITVCGAGPDFRITFSDGGAAFDPLARADPKPARETDRVGGYGIYICRKFMDRVEYRRDGGKNMLSLYPFPNGGA